MVANNSNSQSTSANETGVQIFNSPEFGQIRTITSDNNEPLFCLRDVTEVLSLNPGDTRRRLDDEVVSTHPIPDSLGRMQLTNFVNEDGLYDVILDSRKPEAKAFRKWITSEVLPSIRKNGGYVSTTAHDTPEMIMARALQVAAKTIEDHKQQLQILAGAVEIQQDQIRQLAPKAEYTDEVLQSTSTFTTTQIAKDLGMSAIGLNQRLKKAGVQFRQSGQWFLTSKYQNKGYADMRVSKYVDMQTDEVKTTQSMVWTEKGRLFIHQLWKGGLL